MKRSALAPSTKPMKRSGFTSSPVVITDGDDEVEIKHPKRLKSRQRAVTVLEKVYWSALASQVGCIACRVAGLPFCDHVSIHHIDGRTKPGCHQLVLPLCAGHHQQGTGNDPTLVAVHPDKARFERIHGTQMALKALCDNILKGEA